MGCSRAYATLSRVGKDFISVVDLALRVSYTAGRGGVLNRGTSKTFRNSSSAVVFCSGGTRSGWVWSARFL